MLGGHLQPSADVVADELTGVLLSGPVALLVAAAVEQQVVAHTAAYEALLDAGQAVNSMVEVEQLAMVGVEVGADAGVDAAGAAALLTEADVSPVHAVHVGRGASEVGEVALEVGHGYDLPHLFKYALLGAARDELALMGRDGAEGTAAEASSVDVDGVLDHVVSGYALTPVLGMGLAGVGQVEGGVELGGGHRGVWGIDHNEGCTIYGFTIYYLLQEPTGVHHVRLLLDVAEVLGLCAFVAQAFLVAVQHDVARHRFVAVGQVGGLRNGF